MSDLELLSSIIAKYTGASEENANGRNVPFRGSVYFGRTVDERTVAFPAILHKKEPGGKIAPLEPEGIVGEAERIVERMRDQGGKPGDRYWLLIFLMGESNETDSTPGIPVPPPIGGWPPIEEEGSGKRRDREIKRLEARIDELNEALRWSEKMRFSIGKELDTARLRVAEVKEDFADRSVKMAETAARAITEGVEAKKSASIAELNFLTSEKLASERLLERGISAIPLLGSLLQKERGVTDLSELPPAQRVPIACSAIGRAMTEDSSLLLDDRAWGWIVQQAKTMAEARQSAGKPV